MALEGLLFLTPSKTASHFKVEDTMIWHKYTSTNQKIHTQVLWGQTVSGTWFSLGVREVLMRKILRSESWESTEQQQKKTRAKARGNKWPEKNKRGHQLEYRCLSDKGCKVGLGRRARQFKPGRVLQAVFKNWTLSEPQSPSFFHTVKVLFYPDCSETPLKDIFRLEEQNID